jgi:hypothetical protein
MFAVYTMDNALEYLDSLEKAWYLLYVKNKIKNMIF